ncbi:MAG: sufS 2 [Firmicutes bacterium]|nr:sufS 2 [Bacillota bacterium]
MIYLDNAATTWPKPENVYQAVDSCLRQCSGNPGRGGHGSARAATHILYEAREALAELFNIDNLTNIIFTYNATDALNMSLLGKLRPGDSVVTTAMEHNAVARPLRYLETMGVKVHIVPCDHNGKLNLVAMESILKSGIEAIVMSHASNVTGTIMPIYEVGQLATKYQACFIVDAAQTAGVEDIDVKSCAIDMLAFSGHKGLLGPQGTGGLYVREGSDLIPLRYGGTGSLSEFDIQPDFLPDKLESGTPNTPGIAGLLSGIHFIRDIGIKNIRAKEGQLAQQLIDGLKRIKDVVVYGPELPHQRTAVVSFTIGEMDSSLAAYRLDKEFGIACRAGLHCAPWAHRCIGTLKTGVIRFSPGYFNTADEILQAIKAVERIAQGDEG